MVEGRVGGGRREGGGRTEGGGEMRTRRTTTCWRAATLCPPTMGTRRGGGRSCFEASLAAAGPLQGRLAASLAAAGLSGGEFWPLQVYLAASFGRCRAVAGPLHSPLF